MTNKPQRTLVELLMLSDFGRLQPERARELARGSEPVKRQSESDGRERVRDAQDPR